MEVQTLTGDVGRQQDPRASASEVLERAVQVSRCERAVGNRHVDAPAPRPGRT
jgi:hypothetical protein